MDLVNKKTKHSQHDPGYPNFPAVSNELLTCLPVTVTPRDTNFESSRQI